MREKVVPIPFLGKEASAWLYRTVGRVRRHPYRATMIVIAAGVGSVLYEANVTHRNRIPSPNVNNHLEYDLRRDGADSECGGLALRSFFSWLVPRSSEGSGYGQGELKAHYTQDLEQLLDQAEDKEKREELLRVIDAEKALEKQSNRVTMRVVSGQLYVREPHWNIRNNERNWAILARDQQQQKDHYWYRMERSRDDDFARNASTSDSM
ncbi:hypothetical protein ERJ75_001447100 [Trypanosoma vivax]|uniref:Uncharacterized protein n=1 Tax=Trypanosoma vivax (strain Y486) TaxID=1055687 RepID=G0U817_TRYVY|nr:hypothetical protein TRVL_04853 [Trypanosoma vivax]KAH8607068.1 hypothetical protein ERJ75_001447100 [Trypanosoma vivax]CCC52026.1 conserved hypothetical protein [Trypanosoma vivax Y486]